MITQLLYVGVDAIAIALLIMIAARLLLQAPKHKNTWLIVFIALGAISYTLSTRQDYSPLIPEPFRVDYGNFFPILNLLRNATTALFMLLCHSIFRDGSPAPKSLLVLLGVQVFLEEPLAWLLGPAWALAYPTADIILFEVFPSIIQLTFLGFALFWILSERSADLVAGRRRARMFLLVVYIAQVVLSIALERVAMAWDIIPWVAAYPIHMGLVTISIAVSVTILFSLMSTENTGIVLYSKSSPKISPVPPPREHETSDADVARIQVALETEQIYRRTGLSVSDLATHLSLPEYRLRSLIHHHMGYRNFNTLLHHYRIHEICEALADPGQNSTPILTLALSAGYQSINPFNRAFRENKEMTPTEYRRHIQKNGT